MKPFWDEVRALFGGALDQEQVDGINVILGEGLRRDVQLCQMAYILATAKHETAHTMQPISEYGGPSYFKRMYDIEGANPGRAKRLGNTIPGDGVRFHGRGFVQITGRANYQKFGQRYGIDLVNHPDLAKDPANAASIMFDGMLEGLFTGKKVGTYVNEAEADYYNARAVVNGDKVKNGHMIAATARAFESALRAADWPTGFASTAHPAAPQPASPAPGARNGLAALWRALLALLRGILSIWRK